MLYTLTREWQKLKHLRGGGMSQRRLFCVCFMFCFLSLLVSPSIYGEPEVSPFTDVKAVSKKLEEEISRSGLRKDSLGVYVSYSYMGGLQTVYRHNEGKAFIPASLSKIATAGAVLDQLGPSTKFETHLLTDAPIDNGRLQGNLYLRGGGDPGFVSESMWYLVNEFMRTEITTITGDIIVDDTLFDNVRSDPSRQDERVGRAYDAPIGAMSFNWNSINIYVRPGDKAGDPVRVFLDPENSYGILVSRATTGASGSGNRIQVTRTRPARDEDGTYRGDRYIVSGTLALGHNEVVVYNNISDPDYWSGYNLKDFLSRRGVIVQGRVRVGKTPAQAKSLARYESKPVAQMVADLMKFSNNYVAEMLTKNLAVHKNPTQASLDQGMEMIRNYILKLGIPVSRFTLVNPSGLTRENKVHPKDLHTLLTSMRTHFSYFAENLAAFPIAGVDGTLKGRMSNSVATGRVRAKTGMLNGVSGLAGYAGLDDGGIYTFVFVFNGRGADTDRARGLFDRLAQHLVN